MDKKVLKTIIEEAVEKTLKPKPSQEQPKKVVKEKVMPLDKEHLNNNQERLNKELMKKWCK